MSAGRPLQREKQENRFSPRVYWRKGLIDALKLEFPYKIIICSLLSQWASGNLLHYTRKPGGAFEPASANARHTLSS